MPARISQLAAILDPRQLQQAAADLRYLLDRGYPRGASLTLVGNRYDLRQPARQILHRGVWPAAVAADRRRKLSLTVNLGRQILKVDGHNVLLTIENALRGWPLVAADDGWLRDIGQLSRRYRPSPVTREALNLMGRHLQLARVAEVAVFYDAPMSGSGELAAATRAILQDYGLTGAAVAIPVPEAELMAWTGPVATSDSALLDVVEVAVDLAGEIIRQLPSPWIITLEPVSVTAPAG